jgi:predicted esterase
MTRGALVATVAYALLLGSSTDDLRVSLRSTAAAYLSGIATIAPVAGRETTFDYYERLNQDLAMLDADVPQGYTPAEWSQMVDGVAALDLSLATQLVDRSYRSMAEVRGLGEVLVRSSRDGTMQPVAVYVPVHYTPGRPAPLIVMLHGQPQSETQLLASSPIAPLAEATGAIVVAPWGRGYYDFRRSSTDVYDALHEAVRAFSIDRRKQYLAGYSMGGFSVFEVAPIHPGEWAAVMCIAGSLLGSDSDRLLAQMPRTPFYILTGSADESIPTRYPTSTAAFLSASGLDVSFYSQSGGTHRLSTLMPILRQSWNDMLSGIVRAPPSSLAHMALPSVAPIDALRP